MHHQSFNFVAKAVLEHGTFRSVLEIGALDINGSVRPLFLEADSYIGIDMQAGRGVDVVLDAREYEPAAPVDCVICVNTLEHAPDKGGVVRAAWRFLKPGGAFIMTAAAGPWPPHSGVDGGPLRRGEYYGNVDPEKAEAHLVGLFAETWFSYDAELGEVYAVCWKAGE